MGERRAKQSRAGVTGLEVSITGRLAAMTRDEAIERIHAAGGRYARTPRESTALLVVGQAGPPLGEDGRLTHSLRAARELEQDGVPLRIIQEEELLALLDLDEARDELHRLYTTEQLARILSVGRGEVRAWVRRGLVQPARIVGRLCFFDFAEVASARTLVRLLREGVPVARIRSSLSRLAAWRGGTSTRIADLEALERTRELYVRLEDGRLVAPDGQLQLAFEAAEEAPLPSLHARAPSSAESWFERGIEAEELGQFEAAAAAYQRALQEGGARPEVLFNLGNTLYALDRREAAATSFEQAAELDPDYVEAWNNLGNVLAELDRDSDAVRAYRRGLAIAPDYADAHFNLAEALTRQGEAEKARAHWRAYLRLDPASPWASEVRARLGRSDES
ncbi:MAG: tetratricopeptide repeat protein [bacterium]|nr:tetratricopeptide repeat protein [bacterium]